MSSRVAIARALAVAFLAGPLDSDDMFERGARLLGRRWRWLRPLSRRVSARFAHGPRPRKADVVQFLLGDDGFVRACKAHELKLVGRLGVRRAMFPVQSAQLWSVPAICNSRDLANWLGIGIQELEWFADLRGTAARQVPGRLSHYHYRVLAKRFGQVRLIEAPKPRLKAVQRRILKGILEQIPPHQAAHGFRRGGSIKSFAAPHTDKRVVLRIDLRDFFPSISLTRVQALFRTVGYPEEIADLLAGLCTHVTPAAVWEDDTLDSSATSTGDAQRRYARAHLPQGAPTSPALANLCAYRLDCRLAGLARASGGVYTRYADDLAFSGNRELERGVKRFHVHACATAMEEGFAVHHRKTRIMRQGVRQRLAGIVVNKHVNVLRADYDRLKATLTNCIRRGAEHENRMTCPDWRSHLLGRVTFVESVNPTRGRQLRELFERIDW